MAKSVVCTSYLPHIRSCSLFLFSRRVSLDLTKIDAPYISNLKTSGISLNLRIKISCNEAHCIFGFSLLLGDVYDTIYTNSIQLQEQSYHVYFSSDRNICNRISLGATFNVLCEELPAQGSGKK